MATANTELMLSVALFDCKGYNMVANLIDYNMMVLKLKYSFCTVQYLVYSKLNNINNSVRLIN